MSKLDEVLSQVDAEFLGAPIDVVAVDFGREALVFKLLLHAGRRQVRNPRRPYQRRRRGRCRMAQVRRAALASVLERAQ